MNELILGLFWMTYYLIHSMMASMRFKHFIKLTAPFFFPYYRLVYSIFATVNLILLLQFHLIVPSQSMFKSLGLQWVGFAFLLSGGVVLLIAVRNYGARFLWRETKVDTLITTGLNAYVRHPLYFGILLLLFGIFLLSPLWKNMVLLIVSTLYLIVGILLEERKLIAEFGSAYLAYRKRVSMLIPWIF